MSKLTAPSGTRKEVLARDDGMCQYCGSERNVDVHHIKPTRNGGGHEPDNLITLCHSCHKLSHSIVPDGRNPVDAMSEQGVPTRYVDDPRVSRWAGPILDELSNGRATPTYIREQTGIKRHRVNSCLSDMISTGWVEKISRGLYEITDDGREEVSGDE